jgi:hypothetical protein
MKQHFSTRRFVWSVSAYRKAREGVITLQEIDPSPRVPSGKPPDPERSEREAARRAKTKVRRLCVANGLDRLWTVTYATEPESEAQIVRDVAVMMRRLHHRFPKWRYLYVIERGEKSGRLHVHFATNVFVPKAVVASTWDHGFVDVRRITTGRGGDPRVAARYLSKYVAKASDDGRRERSRRRFVPSLGLLLDCVKSQHNDYYEAERALAVLVGGGPPQHVWRSSETSDWRGPPCTVAFWP